MASRSGAVLSISSHVARGSVGNRAMVFALERLGFTVWAVPTVLLPHHPGHGPADENCLDDKAFDGAASELLMSGRSARQMSPESSRAISPRQARPTPSPASSKR